MPKDALDIIDTAVKIGLGALISGIATYSVSSLNHSKAAEKATTEKRREIIESVAENIERFFALLFSFRAGVQDWVVAREEGRQLSKDHYEKVLNLQREIPRAYKELTSSEAKLLLIGAKRAQQLVRNFGHDISEQRKIVILGNESLTTEQAERDCKTNCVTAH